MTLRLSASEVSTLQAAADASRPPVPLRTYARWAALEHARGGAAPAAAGPEGLGERCGVLRTPQSQEPACYEVRDAEALITSHDPTTWEPHPDYPSAVQERDYKGDKNERFKVERIAGAPVPDLVLALTPTAVDGPPVVTGRGVVLGGNGRCMGLRLAYERGTADDYRAELRKRAPLFGLAAAAADQVARPVLVRVVRGLDDAGPAALAAASSRYNEGLTNSLDERARAVSLSRRLSAETLAAVGLLLDEHETLRAAMAASGPRFVRRLEADGLVTAQNRAALVDSAGGLTEAGKVLVEGAFLGLAVGTPERLAQAAPATLGKVERLVPFLARVRARKNGHDLTPLVQDALDVLHRAAAAGLTVQEFTSQGDMFGPGLAPDVVRMAHVLASAPAKRLASAARAWVGAADYDPGQPLLFGSHATPAQALGAFFVVALPEG